MSWSAVRARPFLMWAGWPVHPVTPWEWVQISLARTTDPFDMTTGYLGICTDITEQKQAQEALTASEAGFRTAIGA